MFFPRVRLLLSLLFSLCLVASAAAQSETPDVSHLVLDGSGQAVDSRLAGAMGTVDIWVRLTDPPLAVANGPSAKQKGARLSPSQQRNYLRQLAQKQDAAMAKISALGGTELARVSKGHNALAVAIDASKLSSVAALPEVRTIRPVVNYELALANTVPYVGAAAVQGAGFDGTGTRVAILDSGIDYTHRNLGGDGTLASYTAAYGTTTADPRNKTLDGLFPTAKVVGGFDFVGETWPTPANSRTEDPDPIDCGPTSIPAPCAGGHGTHVADIAGGRSNDGTHKGVAPGASLYAVKVCSAVATSCSGIALLKGIDFSLDPDGDGVLSDAVDVINMSLGSNYGQREDDLSEASAIASRFGVVVVAAAGNAGDRPYIVSSPSTAPEVISVAQTQVPTAFQQLMTIVSPAAIAGDYLAVHQAWSAALTTVIEAPVQYGNGAGGNLDGCAAFPAGSLTGRIVLVDRGTCNFSDKIRNVQNGGGLIGVIGLIAPGAPFSGAFGGGAAITIPGYMISQAVSNMIKGQLPSPGVVARFDPANVLPLGGSVVATSARGPGYSYNAIKPEIGAPGASVSADAGSGTGQSAFGGTSGATPMVAGSAALLVDKYPTRTPAEIKSVLMNTAETNIQTDPVASPGVLAPITRIGGGELRVDRAADSGTAAWSDEDFNGSLSFGYQALSGTTSFQKSIVVRNYGASSRTYSITPGFRYADDAASGAVSFEIPSSVTVPGNGSKSFKVKITVDVTKLPIWTLNGGSRGGDGFRLQGVEFDGYIAINGGAGNSVNVAWHVLPHRSASVTPASNSVTLTGGTGSLLLDNASGAVAGRTDVFSLLGTSGRFPVPYLPSPGDNYAIIDLKSVGARLVGIGGGAFGIQIAVNTFGARSHPNYPAEFDIYFDTDRDGDFDSVMFNLENGGFGATGQNVVAAGPLPSGPFTAFFFADADLDSGNAILTAPLSALGLTPTTQFDFSVYAFDNYFTGALTDAITGMTYTAGAPRYVGSGIPPTGVPAGGSSTLNVSAVPGGDAASPSQTGLLLMYRDGRSQREADPIAVSSGP
jgi:subtilisin family serine protease